MTGEDGETSVVPLYEDPESMAEFGDTTSLRTLMPAQLLVMGATPVEDLPEAVVCQAPASIEPPPNRVGVGDAAVYPTAEEALQAFVSGPEQAPALTTSRYGELVVAGDTIGYGVELEDGPGYVVVVAVERSPEGWTVDSWESSGC